MKDWVASIPRQVGFEYESLEDIVCHLYELASLDISAFEGAPRKTLYIQQETGNARVEFLSHASIRTEPPLIRRNANRPTVFGFPV